MNSDLSFVGSLNISLHVSGKYI